MLKQLLFYLYRLKRYEFFNCILLEITISGKTHSKFIDTNRNPLISSACVGLLYLEFMGTTKAKRPNEVIFS